MPDTRPNGVTATLGRERGERPWEVGERVSLYFDGEEDSREWLCVEVEDGRLVRLASTSGEPRYVLNFSQTKFQAKGEEICDEQA